MMTEREKKKPNWVCVRGAENSHQVHGNLWPHGTPRHRAQHRGAGRKKEQMTAGGSGRSLTPMFDCCEQ